METKTIGTFIAALRKANGLTQRQLAEKLNVSDKAVSRWERDEAMPDLTLIPVLAEIFGVTSDEILRGQRKSDAAPETKYDTRKTEQQKKNLVRQTLSNFRIRSLISGAIAVVGLIAAMIGNTGFLRAYIGFFAGAIFYVAATFCQSIFTVQAANALDSDELEPEAQTEANKELALITGRVCTLICGLFGATLPLLVLVEDSYMGLGSSSWGYYGLIFGAAAILVALLARFLVNIKLGYGTVNKQKFKLLLRSLVILLVLWALSWLSFAFIYAICYNHCGTRTTWDNWEELKTHLEEPRTPDGEPMTLVDTDGPMNIYQDEDGEHYYVRSDEIVWVYEANMETPVYTSHHYNLSVASVNFGRNGDCFPATTLSPEGQETRDTILQIVEALAYTVLLVEPIGMIIYYRKKAKQQ